MTLVDLIDTLSLASNIMIISKANDKQTIQESIIYRGSVDNFYYDYEYADLYADLCDKKVMTVYAMHDCDTNETFICIVVK